MSARLLLASALLLGCPSAPPEPVGRCASAPWQRSRAALLDALGTVDRSPSRDVEWGERSVQDRFAIQALSWPHPSAPETRVRGVLYTPLPAPGEAVPLLLNVHGHWGAGVESEEVSRRAALLAQAGWAALSVGARGAEWGAETPPEHQIHYRTFAYAGLGLRESGFTPLGWDAAAALAGLERALDGALGFPVDPQRVATMGFSGGAERAVALTVLEPRIAAAVLGSYEYAFTSGHGASSCACGSLRGAGEQLVDAPGAASLASDAGYGWPAQAWRWLALSACGPAGPRPILAWDGRDDDPADAALVSMPGVTRWPNPSEHGLPDSVLAESWMWLERTLGRPEPDRAVQAAGLAAASSLATTLPPTMRPPLGRFGGLREGPGPADPESARSILGQGARDHRDPAVRLDRPGEPDLALPEGEVAWLAVGAPAPTEQVLGTFDDRDYESVDQQLLRWGGRAALDSLAPIAWLEPRVGRDHDGDVSAARFGSELGLPALAAVVADTRAARQRVAGGRDPAEVPLLGIGAGGVAALWAAWLDGGKVAIVSGPVSTARPPDATGPRSLYPWPTWVLAPVERGAALDPWHAASGLGDRVRWLDPRDGAGAPWPGELPNPRAADLAQLLSWGSDPASSGSQSVQTPR